MAGLEDHRPVGPEVGREPLTQIGVGAALNEDAVVAQRAANGSRVVQRPLVTEEGPRGKRDYAVALQVTEDLRVGGQGLSDFPGAVEERAQAEPSQLAWGDTELTARACGDLDSVEGRRAVVVDPQRAQGNAPVRVAGSRQQAPLRSCRVVGNPDPRLDSECLPARFDGRIEGQRDGMRARLAEVEVVEVVRPVVLRGQERVGEVPAVQVNVSLQRLEAVFLRTRMALAPDTDRAHVHEGDVRVSVVPRTSSREEVVQLLQEDRVVVVGLPGDAVVPPIALRAQVLHPLRRGVLLATLEAREPERDLLSGAEVPLGRRVHDLPMELALPGLEVRPGEPQVRHRQTGELLPGGPWAQRLAVAIQAIVEVVEHPAHAGVAERHAGVDGTDGDRLGAGAGGGHGDNCCGCAGTERIGPRHSTSAPHRSVRRMSCVPSEKPSPRLPR